MNPHWNSYLNRSAFAARTAAREQHRIRRAGAGRPCWASRRARRPSARRAESAGREAAAFRAQGQARDLPVHARRAVAGGHVRLQAAAEARSRQAAAVQASESRFERDRQSAEVAVGVQAVRPERHVGQRSVSASSRSRWTTSASSTRCGARTRGTAARCSNCTPAATRSSGPAWARGSPTDWAPRTRACRASSPSARRRATAAPTTTAPHFCRRRTRARRSARWASRRATRRFRSSRTPKRRATSSGWSWTSCRRMNREQLAATGPDAALEGRIESFELAFRMQIGSAGIAGHLRRIGRDAEAVRPRQSRHGGLRPAVPDGAAALASAACASCR